MVLLTLGPVSSVLSVVFITLLAIGIAVSAILMALSLIEDIRRVGSNPVNVCALILLVFVIVTGVSLIFNW